MTNIELLESILRNNCPFVLDNLQSGLSEQQIGELLTDSSLNYDEIRALYSWRNGMSEQYKPCFSKYSFHPFGNLIPLQKAVLVKKENETKNRWDRRLFPIISNNEGDYLLMDIDKNSKTYGFLYVSSIELLIVPPQTIYDSFTCFVKSVLHCYASETYVYNKINNEIEVNLEFENVFSEVFNPQSEFWKRE